MARCTWLAALAGVVGCVGPSRMQAPAPASSTWPSPPSNELATNGIAPPRDALATGWGHACVLREGRVWCWGSNRADELGDPRVGVASRPVRGPDLEGVVELAAGRTSTCARHEDGSVTCWGDHGPFAAEHRLDQWRALVEARDAGKLRAIGVSNYRESHIEEIRQAGLPLPDANQLELHPWSQKPELVAYLHDHAIQPIAYSSLVPLSTWRTVEGQGSAKTEQMRAEGARDDSPFRTMARKHGVSEAQVLLRWGVQRGFAVIPKSTNPDRIRTNLDLFSFELDADDMATIAEMDRGDGVAWTAGDPSRAP